MILREFKIKLDEKINEANQIFLVPHMGVDIDAIASCVAMEIIVRKSNKPVYIIIDEDPVKIESGAKVIIEEIRKNINVINLERYKQLAGDKDLLIMLDVNKESLICCREYLNKFKDIVIIDHHKETENTVQSDCKYIDVSLSSVSEFMAELLCYYLIKCDKTVAEYLLAGIYLDTKRLEDHISPRTMRMVYRLMDRGADMKKVDELFLEDFVSDRKVQNLVSKAKFINYTIAVCIADKDVIYTKEELAKAADYLLKYKVDAGFSVGYIADSKLSISARSKGEFDVGDVMAELSGGGNEYSAATRLENCDIKDVSNNLVKKLVPSYSRKKVDNIFNDN